MTGFDPKDKLIVVTGAASGIGLALAEKFHEVGARMVICADIDIEGAQTVANGIGGVAVKADVSGEDDVKALIDMVEAEHGAIDLFCSNAGIGYFGGAEVSNEDWDRIWKINVMSHVWAARHLIPKMLERGGGYFLNTASAAGLLSQIGSASYAVTKAAAVSFAEWIAITYGTQGIGVSTLCPQAVKSKMTAGFGDDSVAAVNGMMEAEPVAQACVDAMAKGEFLVLPHEEVRTYVKHKGADRDRWISGMQRLNDAYKF